MFLPMSWTSPFTVAITIVPLGLPTSPDRNFSSSMNGTRWPTACFITRADLTTCGRNILPAPNRSPTTFIPAISGPSMTWIGRAYFRRASSVSSMMCDVMPFTSACERRSSTLASRHARSSTFTLPFALTVSAKVTRRSVGFSPDAGRRLSTTSSTSSRKCGSIWSYTPSWPALTMPIDRPARMAWYRNTVWMASRTASLPRKLKLTLEIPPDTLACGRCSLIQRVALMKSTA